MACTIIIDRVEGILDPVSGHLVSILVEGHLEGDCENYHYVEICAECLGKDPGCVNVELISDSSGRKSWSTLIPNFRCACETTEDFTVTSTPNFRPGVQPSSDDYNNRILARYSDPIYCECNLQIDELSVEIGNCTKREDGTTFVPVTFIAKTSGVSVQDFHWQYGDGSDEWDNADPTKSVVTHEYTPGDHAQVTLIVHGNLPRCETAETLDFVIPDCETEPECPSIDELSVSPDDYCQGGTLDVVLNATISGVGTGQFTWDYGDGTSDLISRNTPRRVHPYAPGNYTATLTLKGPEGCEEVSKSVEVKVEPCTECSHIERLTFIPTCIGDRVQVVLNATISAGSGAYEFTWDYGDGTPDQHPRSNTPHRVHFYTAPGNYTATLTMKGPEGCEEESRSIDITVEPCPNNAPPTSTDSDSSCGGLVWAAVIIAAIAIVLLAIEGCIMTGILLLIGAILLFVYGVLMIVVWILNALRVCKISTCKIAFIHMAILGPLSAIMAIVFAFLPCIALANATLILAGLVGVWGTKAAECLAGLVGV